MNLDKSTFYRFTKEVGENYLIFEDEQIKLNPPYLFRRGKFSKQTDEERERRYQKIYIEAVQELYKNTPPTSHGSLGYVYKLIPYINIEWNIICKYPLEKDIDKIFPLTTEICEKLGYSTNQRSRFINTYKSIKFKVKDHEENFVAFVSNGEDVRMFVNPRIMYKGSNWERVSITRHVHETPSNKLQTVQIIPSRQIWNALLDKFETDIKQAVLPIEYIAFSGNLPPISARQIWENF